MAPEILKIFQSIYFTSLKMSYKQCSFLNFYVMPWEMREPEIITTTSYVLASQDSLQSSCKENSRLEGNYERLR